MTSYALHGRQRHQSARDRAGIDAMNDMLERELGPPPTREAVPMARFDDFTARELDALAAALAFYTDELDGTKLGAPHIELARALRAELEGDAYVEHDDGGP